MPEVPAPSAEAVAASGARMIEEAQKGVVQVRSGRRGAGAGVIWDAAGLVLTNDHVVGGRRGEVRVVLHDGRAFEAEAVGRSRSLDLALLRLRGAPGDLPTPRVGDSDALRVGELVYAVGHPWGRLARALRPVRRGPRARQLGGTIVERQRRGRRDQRHGLP